MKNVNKINQQNNYRNSLNNIKRQYAALKMGNANMGTGNMGYLIPVHLQELIPSQKITIRQSAGIQFQPFVTNLFHELNGEILNYFVPYRLLDDDWEEFITGGNDGTYNKPLPTLNLFDLSPQATNPTRSDLEGSLADYFGMPIHAHKFGDDTPETKPMAYPWRAYNKIYNDHIRLPDLEPTEVDLDSNQVQRGNWDWDYFNRARVYQQRGVVPSVPVSQDLTDLTHEWLLYKHDDTQIQTMKIAEGGTSTYDTFIYGNNSGSEDEYQTIVSSSGNQDFGGVARLKPHSLDRLGMNMNDFMTALAIQRVQINNAKIDTRYVDHLNVRFGIYPQDARLQRAEYLGSSYFNVGVETVTATSSEQQGNITSQGWSAPNNGTTKYRCTEHGILITLMIVKPKPVYEGGLPKMFQKKTRFDFPTPELANLPDVPIKMSELMYTNKDELNDRIFGWQGIYEEYRTLQNKVCGALRPSKDGNLITYTLARFWDQYYPELTKEFVQCNPDQKRILQYPEEDAFIFFVRNDVKTSLPLPTQSEPGELPFI